MTGFKCGDGFISGIWHDNFFHKIRAFATRETVSAKNAKADMKKGQSLSSALFLGLDQIA